MKGARARTLGWLAVAAICSGCLIVPKAVTRTRIIGPQTGPTVHGREGELVLAAAVDGRTLTITAARRRQCVRTRTNIIEVTTSWSAGTNFGDGPSGRKGNGLGPAIFIVIAPVTLFVSGIATSILLATRDKSVKRYRKPISAHHWACPAAASRVSLRVFWPSGANQAVVTDERGRVAVTVPDREPPQGTVLVRTTFMTSRRFRYGGPAKGLSRAEIRAGITSVRPQIIGCGRRARLNGVITLRITIAGGLAGLRTHAGLDPGFAVCVDRALARVEYRPAPPTRAAYPLDFSPQRREGSECKRLIANWRAETDYGKKTLIYRDMPPLCRRMLRR
jgi:hypothetical protein